MSAEQAVLNTAENIADASNASGRADIKQYVSFEAGDEQYAVDIMKVREIKGWTEVTNLPNQPDHVRGVLNLRGAVLPIIDLACRLGGGFTNVTERHVIVIVSMEGRQVGLLVDAVSDILTVPDDKIQPVPETDVREDSRVLSGFLTDEDQLVAMLDLDRLLSGEDLESAATDEALIQ